MEKEFVPYELALKMKALGFDEPCFGWYEHNGNFYYCYQEGLIPPTPSKTIIKNCCLAPTFSQAFRWFRKTYILQHSIDPTSDQQNGELGYNYWIWNYKTGEEYHSQNKNRPVGDWEYKHHEEAELACLEKLIEIIESKSQ